MQDMMIGSGTSQIKGEAALGWIREQAPRERTQRDQLLPLLFPYDRVNMNPGTLGTQSISTVQALSEFYSDARSAFPLGQYQLGREALRGVRTQTARTWGHPEATIAITSGTTTAINALATALFPALTAGICRGPLKMMTTRHEHYGATDGFERHIGYQVVHFEDKVLDDVDAFRKVVETERPDVVLLSHITCDLGRRYQVEKLALSLKNLDRRPIMIIDAAQSLGILPEIPAVGEDTAIDMVVSSCHKWLMGPPGSGISWMSERLASLVKPYYCTAHPLDEDAKLGIFETSGGQDFAKLNALKAAVELYSWMSPEEVLNRSRRLAFHFYQKIYSIFEAAGIKATYFAANGELNHPTMCRPDDFLGVLAIGFADYDPYKLYDFLNTNRIHLKCLKADAPDGRNLSVLRLGFPFYETTVRLDEALNWFRTFLSQNQS